MERRPKTRDRIRSDLFLLLLGFVFVEEWLPTARAKRPLHQPVHNALLVKAATTLLIRREANLVAYFVFQEAKKAFVRVAFLLGGAG